MVSEELPGIIRPRAASVIGVIWLYLGGIWLTAGLAFSVSIGLMSLHFQSLHENFFELGMPLMVLTFPLFMVIVGAWGLQQARGVLKMRAESTQQLARANLVVMIFFCAFTVCFIFLGLAPMRAGLGFLLLALFNLAATATPFFIMRRKLLELYPQFVAKEEWG